MNMIKRIGTRKFIKEVSNNLVKVKFQKWDMECDVYEDTVYVGKTYDKRTDGYFMDFVKEIMPECADYNIYLLSILHEIGHIMTWDEDAADDKDVVFEVLKMMYDEDQDAEKYNHAYFNIPLEYDATMWGLYWAKSHPEIMKKYEWLGR